MNGFGRRFVPGSLTVVGTGIRTRGQLTVEAIGWTTAADSLLYVVSDPIAEAVMRELNPSARSLSRHYSEGMPRIGTYVAMVEEILACGRDGQRTCAAFYGHPGVLLFRLPDIVHRRALSSSSASDWSARAAAVSGDWLL